jgi:tetratricopeptide (TPR) repeat protein
LIRFAFLPFLTLAIAIPIQAAAPEQAQLDSSPALFTVMAAINAAGYSADWDSPNGHPLREWVRAEVLKANPPSLVGLKQFYESHRKANNTAELSQYISFALSVKGPPNFEYVFRDVDVPPDAYDLKGLGPLLAAFYKEAKIEQLWEKSQDSIESYIGRYHVPLTDTVMQVSSYLRQASVIRGRRFQIFIELLAAPNQVQLRSYAGNYTIVVTPSPEPRVFDIRHAYLHYMLDPLASLNREILDRKKYIGEHAQRASALDDAFKKDFLLLTTESLIKAIEAHLDHKPERIEQALKLGYVLTPFFAEQLPNFEKQEFGMPDYFSTMAKAIDMRKEETRLSKVVFDEHAPEPAHVAVPAPMPKPDLQGAARTLAEADQAYSSRAQNASNLDTAKSLYLRSLQQTEEKPAHAAAYYGLARIAALQNDPETAERLFSSALESEPEPQVKAWCLVYMGRLALAAGEPERAAAQFEQVLRVDGASDPARKAAADGLQNMKKQ